MIASIRASEISCTSMLYSFVKFRYEFIACILYYAMHVDLSLTTHYYEFLYTFLYHLTDIEIRIEVFMTISIRIKI